jgi:hypothetical protein
VFGECSDLTLSSSSKLQISQVLGETPDAHTMGCGMLDKG